MQYLSQNSSELLHLNGNIFDDQIFQKNPRRLFLYLWIHAQIKKSQNLITSISELQKLCGGRPDNLREDLNVFAANNFFHIQSKHRAFSITLPLKQFEVRNED